MANRPRGFGMTAELAKKRAAKFDPDLAEEALFWVGDVLSTNGNDEAQELVENLGTVNTEKDVMTALKDGVALCHLINCIKPGSVKKINTNKMAFKQMENIGNFLSSCESIGCNKVDLFQTVDLYEGTNISQVINGIFALGRKAQKIGFDGPRLGPEEASENKREFTEEQLRAGEGVIGLQAGSNKGASQAGQNFGKTRAIID
ncbi:myophilin-like [Hydractinia symbiolongicarpus]|uniref:myophilin-like n=1 Tax=Hydractinia symbiolongicarpus TaxID=13093 RepID=UPI00254B207F|nr:myophilin-like [Hydractinia symbiolongicarpus]